VSSLPTNYELQVRENEKKFDVQNHPNILAPSQLIHAYPLQPMKIRKVGDTAYRFRLKQFYPDFTFKYTYPLNEDTIPPRAPGITLLLNTREGEEAVTLRSDQPQRNRLDDVVQLGILFEFYWIATLDSLDRMHSDSALPEDKVVFSGKDKKMYRRINGIVETMTMEKDHFYSIPGKDSLGFTILQCFPDANLLKAVPATRSEKLNNPVAGVEVWKKGGYSQEIFLYPIHLDRPGGKWDVPGTSLNLTLSLGHDEVVKSCRCYVSLEDSVRQVRTSGLFEGRQSVSFGGKKLRLKECDPGGFWATLEVQKRPGYYFRVMGLIMTIVAFSGFVLLRKANKTKE
jgi:hypothetical protein